MAGRAKCFIREELRHVVIEEKGVCVCMCVSVCVCVCVGEVSPRLRILSGGRYLQINNANLPDAAQYTCVASNAAGETTPKLNLAVTGPAVCVCVCVCVCVYVCVCVCLCVCVNMDGAV